MVKGPDPLTVKVFREALESSLARCSKEELAGILLRMGTEVPPSSRREFLGKIEPPRAAAAETEREPDRSLLLEIRDFRKDVIERMQDPEPPPDDGGWGSRGAGDDPYEDLIEPFQDLAAGIAEAFASGDFSLARRAGRELFRIIEIDDEFGRSIDLSGLHGDPDGSWIGEAWARFLRACYETAAPESRPRRLFEAMEEVQGWFLAARPRLKDIEEITPEALPDRDRFLSEWKAFLQAQEGELADALLREAVKVREGITGLAELAAREGSRRPRAFLDWFDALAAEGRHAEVLAGARKALEALPPGLPIRSAVADRLAGAAASLGNTEDLRGARWEAFIAGPGLERLLDLREAAASTPGGADWMRRASGFIADLLAAGRKKSGPGVSSLEGLEGPGKPGACLLSHARLLAGEWDAALELALDQNVLEWDYSSRGQALVLSIFLARLARGVSGKIPSSVLALLGDYSTESVIRFHWSAGDEESERDRGGFQQLHERRVEKTYKEVIAGMPLGPEAEARYLAFCLDTARRRVEAIVGGKNRDAYERAAVLVAACCETLEHRGESGKSGAFSGEFRGRFSRYPAFQQALREALAGRAARSRRR